MDWIQLTLNTSKEQADFVSEVLMGLECVSVTFSDTFDDEIFEPPVGETPLWQNVTVTALFTIGTDEGAIKESLQQICGIDKVTFSLLKDRVWENECKKDFHAMQFGKRVWICPSWEDSAQLPDGAVVINMDPGLAFGTGTHQTTDLCLQYLDENPPIGQSVIDYGSGTGILAIAAVKLGANQALCVDNDPQAVLATRSNIENNQEEAKIIALHTNDEGQLEKTDLLIANILAKPLVGLCEHFSKLVKLGGQLVLSGILHEQLETILDAYGEYFSKLKVVQKEDWCRVNGIRK
ncbi:Ribosomal protein L11 methyltransferase [uncultured Gammaproteobacteria bacterium]|jgi:ribosomal protein L11 methyltransferase|uniref:Ribosomal protein L11 methyltransferase n=4 Tax=sulfur-oxidizing symbionts TaxID=32036 RepID=A0ACA8ZSZ1_9GAMM|nr:MULTISPECIES: 50S ribosomal protein L11 methyltransferase [sulfur-oxidizing symbionts]CAC5833275.1 Ribosomal protein L11 methyltransferase (EC 2.1.1.-) [uncultured Gammaproteobacteria bacterium]CAB5497688.1 Ribosomal protein L11 methyltransferase [Bathymodiolus azoricus thioautotrophic gill symbiont]CAB5507841.1 Ribosomal protein L11 methyltransferase [Bathymodiolus thermophilus thioautotrophic gill symbiont]CAC9429127.1 Ribosomal protein L11 methyltransferase [uncultured Gammaproteobacteria